MKHFKSVEEFKKELKAFLGAKDYATLKRQTENKAYAREGFDFYLQNRIDGVGGSWEDDIFYAAFPWCNSRKGVDYWININKRWQDYINEED